LLFGGHNLSGLGLRPQARLAAKGLVPSARIQRPRDQLKLISKPLLPSRLMTMAACEYRHPIEGIAAGAVPKRLNGILS